MDSFFIDDTLEYVDGRVSKGSKHFYKGVGVPYNGHYVSSYGDEYEHLCQSDVFYLGDFVSKKCFEGKTGVFQERYQPHFTDWIGGCGEKEIQIVENLWEYRFDRSAIDVGGFEEIAPGQYYLICNYPDGRVNYLDNPNPSNLFTLIAYMVDNDWNFPWDKDSITDINPAGKVTDVADIFQSKELMHKVGYVYSILYSLAASEPEMYQAFCARYMLPSDRQVYYVTNTLSLLMRLGVDIDSCMRDNIGETYKHTVRNFIAPGKNCGFCGVGSCKGRKDSNQSFGEEIRDEYIRRVQDSLQI